MSERGENKIGPSFEAERERERVPIKTEQSPTEKEKKKLKRVTQHELFVCAVITVLYSCESWLRQFKGTKREKQDMCVLCSRDFVVVFALTFFLLFLKVMSLPFVRQTKNKVGENGLRCKDSS